MLKWFQTFSHDSQLFLWSPTANHQRSLSSLYCVQYVRPQELACAPYTAGYLGQCINAIRLIPNTSTAGYCDVRRTNLVSVYTCKNPAITY